ncbi:MAG: NADH:flavin oxidoreductase [Sedimentisphaeraceae bacterium JB056]
MTSSVEHKIFSPLKLKNITLPNRFVRSATYEGMSDSNGVVNKKIGELYGKLAQGGVGTIITGFCFVSKQGRAMQLSQAGLYNQQTMNAWKQALEIFREFRTDTKIFAQLAHTGRQTLSSVTGCAVVGAGNKKSLYFREKTRKLDADEVQSIVKEFADSALMAKLAGFDGVQLHGAHGYLIHQFLSPETNRRNDKWKDGSLFLLNIIEKIKSKCGDDFPVLVKLSWADDRQLKIDDTIKTVRKIEQLVDAVEISYGTMDFAMNIFRGSCPVEVAFKINPIFKNMSWFSKGLWKYFIAPQYLKRLKPFTENYNLAAAMKIKENTNAEVFSVGGFRKLSSMKNAIDRGISAVSLCRPFICEHDLIHKFRNGSADKSKCINCNLCAVHCDGDLSSSTLRLNTKCYYQNKD